MRQGGTLTTRVGVLSIDALDAIEPDDITAADARRGRPRVAGRRDGGDRRPHGPAVPGPVPRRRPGSPPRPARAGRRSADDDVAVLTTRLGRLDARAERPVDAPRARADRRRGPAVRAGDLADERRDGAPGVQGRRAQAEGARAHREPRGRVPPLAARPGVAAPGDAARRSTTAATAPPSPGTSASRSTSVIDLSMSLNPFAPDVAPIVSAARRCGRTATRSRRRRRPRWRRRSGSPADRVVLTNGGAEAIALVAAELGAGEVVDPEFSLYRRHLAEVRPAPGAGGRTRRTRWASWPAADDVAAVWDEAFWPLATGTWTRGDDDGLAAGVADEAVGVPGPAPRLRRSRPIADGAARVARAPAPLGGERASPSPSSSRCWRRPTCPGGRRRWPPSATDLAARAGGPGHDVVATDGQLAARALEVGRCATELAAPRRGRARLHQLRPRRHVPRRRCRGPTQLARCVAAFAAVGAVTPARPSPSACSPTAGSASRRRSCTRWPGSGAAMAVVERRTWRDAASRRGRPHGDRGRRGVAGRRRRCGAPSAHGPATVAGDGRRASPVGCSTPRRWRSPTCSPRATSRRPGCARAGARRARPVGARCRRRRPCRRRVGRREHDRRGGRPGACGRRSAGRRPCSPTAPSTRSTRWSATARTATSASGGRAARLDDLANAVPAVVGAALVAAAAPDSLAGRSGAPSSSTPAATRRRTPGSSRPRSPAPSASTLGGANRYGGTCRGPRSARRRARSRCPPTSPAPCSCAGGVGARPAPSGSSPSTSPLGAQAAEAAVPAAAGVEQPADGVGQALRRGHVAHLAAVALGHHEAGVGEHAQVLDDRLAGRREVVGERGGRLRAVVDEALEDGAAGRVGEDGEQLVERSPVGSGRSHVHGERLGHEQHHAHVPGDGPTARSPTARSR